MHNSPGTQNDKAQRHWSWSSDLNGSCGIIKKELWLLPYSEPQFSHLKHGNMTHPRALFDGKVREHLVDGSVCVVVFETGKQGCQFILEVTTGTQGHLGLHGFVG